MHTTFVRLKNGETYSGPIGLFRPALGWFTFLGEDRRFYFDECESVITPGERVSINSPPEGEIQDEMARAKRNLDLGRLHGWYESDENDIKFPYPQKKFEWEKRYEKQEK